MQKCIAVFVALFITAFIAGCGGSGTLSSGTVIPGVTTEKILDLEVSNRNLFRTTISGIIAYQLNADSNQTASWNSSPVATTTDPLLSLNVTGTWNISTDGSLILTPDGGGTPIQFTRIQRVNKDATGEYWLLFDKSNNISRFYLNLPTAQAYNPEKMGGTVQGTSLTLANNVSTYAGIAGTAGFTNNSTATLPTTAKFNHPTSITTTDGTNFYVADYLNHAIRKIDKSTNVVTTFAGSTIGLAGLVDANVVSPATTTDATLARFNRPSDITTDGTNLYVVDSFNNAIRIINISTQQVSTIGSTSSVAGSVDSTVPTDVRFNAPTGITTDGTNLYVTDSGNHTIRKIVISSGAVSVSTLAGVAGVSGSSDTTSGTPAHFFLPARITTDGSNLYVTDFNNRTVRKIVISTGVVSTLAGVAGNIGSANTAPGVAATFNQLNGITTDGKNLYVTDSFSNTVRMIVISTGAVTTIAGTPSTPGTSDSAGSVEGIGTAARFNAPVGITTDGTSLFVADSLNNTIRQIK